MNPHLSKAIDTRTDKSEQGRIRHDNEIKVSGKAINSRKPATWVI